MSLEHDPAERFDKVAEAYRTSTVHADHDGLAALAERVGQQGGFVIDVGAGAGHTAFAFARHADRVAALDPAPSMLRAVREGAVEHGLDNVETVTGHGEKLPFFGDEADGIVSRLACHHFEDVSSFIGECRRVLKPGGWLLIVDTISPENEHAAIEVNRIEMLRDPSHVCNLKASEWLQMLGEECFHIEWCETALIPLDYEDWLERQQVGRMNRDMLERLIFESAGGTQMYLAPVVSDRKTFHLRRICVLAKKAA